MELPKNQFKAALQAGQQQIGLWCSTPDAGVAEVLANCGFDWVMIDTEHSVIDQGRVLAMLQATAPYPTHFGVRPGWNDAVEIKRLLDSSAQTILVPYVQTAEEAARAVAAMRYPPHGMRGVSALSRASRYGAIPDYTARANAEVCLLVQVETASALAQIEAIAAVDGVDGIFIGPADLAASMGHPGNPGHPEVKAAILDAIRRIVAAGTPAGILSLDPGFLSDAIAAGTTFTAVDTDTALLQRGARAAAARWKG
ncbi:MAG: 4-hydroxy-2-oxo-heptane-1,7-dioate aldolase [Rhodobacterales bacterium]|nr:4-hydroxy-2-oxo-heptane-1,7-dioate aldolase [Rhodobacterales bacterium]NCT12440.1 4-hydroxy-2-oxo-heptane-1,7-dioate aldolase [Rhodobacterales bacterium]